MNSLSGRLSWGLALSLVVILVAQWVVASFAIRHLIENQVSNRLIQDGESLLAGINFYADGLYVDPRRVNTIYQRPFSGHYFVISAGNERYVSRSLWDKELLVPKVNPGVDIRLTISGPENQSLLSVTHGYLKHGRQISILVAEDIEPFNAELRKFLWVYSMASVAILVILMLVQHLIIRYELSPLQELRANMARLERGETDRIETVGPAEIAPMITELNRLLATMGKRTRRSREALGNLAHALKTRLAVLTQLSQEPEMAALPAAKSTIATTTEAMRAIVERELKRARLIGIALPGQRVDLRDEIGLLVQTLQMMYADRKLQINWQVADGARFVGDQEDLLELLGNLLDNACKWSRGSVMLRAEQRDGVVFLIEDDGPGCDLATLHQLTRRGFRADEGKPGSGLGLAIVRDIVESYAGTLTIERSKKMGGLSVSVWLPNR